VFIGGLTLEEQAVEWIAQRGRSSVNLAPLQEAHLTQPYIDFQGIGTRNYQDTPSRGYRHFF
jgi:hypothetical protein